MEPKLTKWVAVSDTMVLRRLGKMIEELGELSCVAGRCVIQGIDEIDPGTGKTNRLRLEQEIADVMAQCEIAVKCLDLDDNFIVTRTADKVMQMRMWDNMYEGE